MELVERFRGSLLGLAVGDALGTTVEFSPRGSFTPVETIVGGGPFHLGAGEWTDDTSMALCLAESLVEKSGFDPADQMERYLRWWREGHLSSNGRCFDIGVTVSGALRRFELTGEPFSGSTDPNSAGNGSIMRLAPVPLFYQDDPALAVETAAKSSRTTHGAAEAVDGCRYLAALIVGALRGAPKEVLLSDHFEPTEGLWRMIPLAPKIAEVAAGSYKRREPPEIKGSGYVVRSLEASLWAFAKSNDFREGALLAVNLGDDADTTGAVYGQLAGAYYGERGIPREWRDVIAKKDIIVSMADRLYEARSAAQNTPHAASFANVTERRAGTRGPGTRTSDTDPIVVNFVAAEDLKLPGRLGLTFAPGKKQPHGQSGHWDRDLDADLTRLRDFYGADVLVSLLEEHELERLRIKNLRRRAEELGLRSVWFPIRDQSVPSSAEKFAGLVGQIVTELRSGSNVVIHCMGGLGRTGLAAAACLASAAGLTSDEAVSAVRAARRGAVETDEQEEFVKSFVNRLQENAGGDSVRRPHVEAGSAGAGPAVRSESDANEAPDPAARMVQSSITSVGFPETLDEVFDMLEKNEYAGEWLSDMDTLLDFDPAAGTVWTAPKWMTEGDVLFFYHTKRGALRTQKLRNEARRLFPLDSNIVRFLDRAARLSDEYGGKIFACASVTGSSEYYAKENEHFDSRSFAPLGEVHVFARPLASDDFKDFVKISQNTLTPLYARQFDGIKRLLAGGNELPPFLRDAAGGEQSFRNVGRDNWPEVSCRPETRFIHEAQIRAYFLDFMLDELKDRGSALLEECLCVRGAEKTGFADYFVRLHGRWVPVEAKLNILAERDLLGQVAKYVGVHSFTPTLGANRERSYAADGHSLCLVADQSGVYVVCDGAFHGCAPGWPAWPRAEMNHEKVAEMRARLRKLL